MSKQKKRKPGKPHGMNLAEARNHDRQVFDELVKAEAWRLFLQRSDNLLQQAMGAAFMAAANVFQMGPGRCVAFGNTALQYLSDYGDDPEIVYAREKIDRWLKQICGENFDPWEVQYGKRVSTAVEEAEGEEENEPSGCAM